MYMTPRRNTCKLHKEHIKTSPITISFPYHKAHVKYFQTTKKPIHALLARQRASFDLQ